MKRNAKVLALMALMAAGVAGAQAGETLAGPTRAGIEIKNTASASFQIVNADGTTKDGPGATSNEVRTVVSSVPSFTIVPNDSSTDPTVADYAGTTIKQNAIPGAFVTYEYTLTNTGNVPNESYGLTNTAPTETVLPGTPVFYATAADAAARTNPITSLTEVDPGEQVKFYVVYQIPANAANNATYGTDPTGTRRDNPAFADENTILPVDRNNSNVTTVNRTTVVSVGPVGAPDATGAADQQTQTLTALPTTVTFTNTVKNGSNVPDTLDITAVLAGAPAGTTVTLFKADGTTPLPDTDSDGTPDVGSLPAGGTADIVVKITYPPTVTATQLEGTDVVTITATSSFNTDVKETTIDQVVTTIRGVDLTSTPTGPGSTSTNPLPTDSCTAPDLLTSVPVVITNTGSVADSYNLTGKVTINGSSPNIVYYDTAATTGGSAVTSVGPIAPGQSATVYARVTVPCGTPAGQTVTLNPVATSTTTGTVTDTQTVPVYVGPNSAGLGLAKFVKGGTGGSTWKGVDAPADYGTGTGPNVAPGGTINYVIIGKNFYNTEVRNVILTDDLNSYLTFSSATCAVYSDNKTPANPADDVKVSDCIVRGTTTLTSSAVNLAIGEYVRMDITVKVK